MCLDSGRLIDICVENWLIMLLQYEKVICLYHYLNINYVSCYQTECYFVEGSSDSCPTFVPHDNSLII